MKQKALDLFRQFYHRVKYGVSSRKCPVCECVTKKFLEFGINPRPDAECPACGALERHRLFWLFLKRKSGFFTNPPKRALHVAPEAVFATKFRKLLGDAYLTADLFAANVDVKMDITDIDFPDNTFDFIYCSHVLEHVPDDRKAMREFRRVLTENGIAILLVPISREKTFEDLSIQDPKERQRLFGQKDHVRCYGPDYQKRLSEEGMRVEKISPEDFLKPQEIRKMGITKASGDIFVCRKQLEAKVTIS